MNTAPVGRELERIAALDGVRAAVAASADEGLLIHAAGEEAVDAAAVAALFASLFQRAATTAAVEGRGQPRLLRVRSGGNEVLAASTGAIVLIVRTQGRANAGRLRLELLRAVEALR